MPHVTLSNMDLNHIFYIDVSKQFRTICLNALPNACYSARVDIPGFFTGSVTVNPSVIDFGYRMWCSRSVYNENYVRFEHSSPFLPSHVARYIILSALESGLSLYIHTQNAHYRTCTECGELCDDAELIQDSADEFICPECLEESSEYSRCADCGRVYLASDLTHVYDTEEDVCEGCLQGGDYFQCDDCNEWHSSNRTNSYFVSDTRETICEDCFQQGSYFRCESCDYVYSEGAYGTEGCCTDCCRDHDEEHDELHSYGFKPEPKFHSLPCETSRLYVGIENEFSFNDYADRNAMLDNIFKYNFDDVFYFKEDSSLTYGAESVTHPCTLAYLQAHRADLQAFFDCVEDYAPCIQDGLHVHINRKHMTKAHENRFAAFYYTNAQNFRPVARRAPNTYCHELSCPTCGSDVYNECSIFERYNAINFQNKATLEVRIFHATTDVVEYLGAVEMVHSIYQFTKRACTLTEILHHPWRVWLRYLEFIATDKRYPDLIALLSSKYTPIERALVERVDKAQQRVEKNINARRAA